MNRHDDGMVSNPSSNPSFGDVLSLSRRQVMKGGLGAMALAAVGGPKELLAQTAGSALLGFTSVPLTGEDRVMVPRGYTANVLYAWGDPVSSGPEWDTSALDTWVDQEQQAGMHHDGMYFFPLPYGSTNSSRGLLVMNHEYVDHGLLFRDATANWSADKVRKSQAAHGVSVIEIALQGDRWEVVRPSTFARRITGYTPMTISGPAAGDPALRTAADPSGTFVLGTVNNCANGFTPWGTYLTCEENFNGYFVNRSTPIPANQTRYGITAAGSGYRWHEFDGRWDAAAHPNEPNRFGWVVEIDPFDPRHTPVKRTALGRIKHEGAWPTVAPDGRLVVYMGDDEQFEYVYKFVTRDPWNPSSRSANTNLLDNGTLYVAQFSAGGAGRWIPLVFGSNGLDPSGGFSSQADVLVRTRQASDRVGATRMDRPEWITVMPNRDVYLALTNNSARGASGRPGVDAANPRVDNTFGHIVRWTEDGANPTALTFRWSIFVQAGDRANANAAKRGNIRGDTFGSPDGLWGDSRGVLWIQTDISTSALGTGDYVNIPTNMMLAADPATGDVRRFLTGPRGCEVTGVTVTPDMRTMFVNIQHPGEPASGDSNPNATGAISTWPDGPGIARPRAATVVIRKGDGGIVGT